VPLENRNGRGVLLSVLAVWLIYLAIRVMLVPADATVAGGIEHDAAYLSIVAGEVRDGHGFVNPAHWLLFLWPKSLPMPYHNANPGFPTLMALVSMLFGVETARAALLISAVSSGLLALSVFALVSRYTRDWRVGTFLAVFVILFPPVLTDSLSALPDALCVALGVGSLALVVRSEESWTPAAAGLVLGLAWLVRSSTTLMLLPMVWFLFRTRRDRLKSVLFFGIAFGIAISPWLIYTWHVWGSPFRSDAYFYLFQDYHAQSNGGDLDRFWRSLDPPPALGEVLRRDAGGFAKFYFRNIPYLIYIALAYFSGWSKIAAAVYLAVAGYAAYYSRRFWKTLEFQAGALLLLLTLAMLNIRAHSYEARYLGAALVLLLLWLALPFTDWLARRPKGTFEWTALAVGLACAAVVILQDATVFGKYGRTSEHMATIRNEDRQLQKEVTGEEPVLIPGPYFYTLFTGHSGINPPYSDKPRLLEFMNKYSTRFLAVPTARLTYYYPQYQAFGPELRPVREVGSLTVFERTQ
jgi:Glycosyltransferase family 87